MQRLTECLSSKAISNKVSRYRVEEGMRLDVACRIQPHFHLMCLPSILSVITHANALKYRPSFLYHLLRSDLSVGLDIDMVIGLKD